MGNPNADLLRWAIQNIEEWDDGYTHLRGDGSCNASVFYTNDDWVLEEDIWVEDTDEYAVPYDVVAKGPKFNPPQTISKEEWVAAKKKAQGFITIDELIDEFWEDPHFRVGFYEGKDWLRENGVKLTTVNNEEVDKALGIKELPVIRLPEKDVEFLDLLAEFRGVVTQDLVRQVLTDYINAEARKIVTENVQLLKGESV